MTSNAKLRHQQYQRAAQIIQTVYRDMIDRRCMQMRYLAVTKMQQFARCIMLRRNFLLQVARMTHARQVIQRAVQVYMFSSGA